MPGPGIDSPWRAEHAQKQTDTCLKYICVASVSIFLRRNRLGKQAVASLTVLVSILVWSGALQYSGKEGMRFLHVISVQKYILSTLHVATSSTSNAETGSLPRTSIPLDMEESNVTKPEPIKRTTHIEGCQQWRTFRWMSSETAVSSVQRCRGRGPEGSTLPSSAYADWYVFTALAQSALNSASAATCTGMRKIFTLRILSAAPSTPHRKPQELWSENGAKDGKAAGVPTQRLASP